MKQKYPMQGWIQATWKLQYSTEKQVHEENNGFYTVWKQTYMYKFSFDFFTNL